MKNKLMLSASLFLSLMALNGTANAQCDNDPCAEVVAVSGSNSNVLTSYFSVDVTNLGGNGHIWEYEVSAPINLTYKVTNAAHVTYYNSLPPTNAMTVIVSETCVCRGDIYRHIKWNVVK